jgi:hypothetical protein
MKLNFKLSDLRKLIETPEYLKSSIDENRKDYYGYSNFAELETETAKPFETNGVNNETQISSNIYNSVCGFAPNVPAYLNGEPESMYNFETTTEVNYHELDFYICLGWNVTSNEIKRNGKILADYLKSNTSAADKFKITFHFDIQALDNERTNTKVKDGKYVQTTLEITDFDDYVTEEILNLVCSPALFRLYMIGSLSVGLGETEAVMNGNAVSFDRSKSGKQNSNMIDFMNMQAINFR